MSEEVEREAEVELESKVVVYSISIILVVLRESMLPFSAYETLASKQPASS